MKNRPRLSEARIHEIRTMQAIAQRIVAEDFDRSTVRNTVETFIPRREQDQIRQDIKTVNAMQS